MGSCWLSLGLCLVLCGFVKSMDGGDVQIFQKVLLDCLTTEDKYLCLTDRIARAVERAIHLDVPILEGITFKRNKEKSVNLTQPRSLNGLNKLTSVIYEFLDSHILSVDLSKVRELKDEDGEEELKKGTTKISKKEKKYFQYTMLVLLGIFGLTTPLIMKTLALIAGKALIASKIALIMVGSVALKKIFQADNDGGGVKVHTHTIPIHDDDHDRYMDVSDYNYFGKGNLN